MQRILDLAHSVNEEYGGRNIFETAENSGVNVWYRFLGGLKGFYMCELGKRYIIINDFFDKMTQTVVCAHELGHDMLHRELSAEGIRDNTLFLAGNKTEREANIFAAEILISDEEILSEMEYCQTIEALSYSLGYMSEIVSYKLEILNYLGYGFNLNEVGSDFLK